MSHDRVIVSSPASSGTARFKSVKFTKQPESISKIFDRNFDAARHNQELLARTKDSVSPLQASANKANFCSVEVVKDHKLPQTEFENVNHYRRMEATNPISYDKFVSLSKTFAGK